MPAAAAASIPTRLLLALTYPFRCWNWKSALLSVTLRSIALFLLVAHRGSHAGLRAAFIEACYVALTAGIWAALQQGALAVDPRWLGNLLIVVVVPVLAQSADYTIQHHLGTPGMRTASIGMVFWGVLSASFHLYLMRHGAMLVGDSSPSLARDFKRMPRLILGFILVPVQALRKLGEVAPKPTLAYLAAAEEDL